MFRGLIRRVIAVAGLIALAACSSDLTAPQRSAEIVFRLDAASCHGSSVFELFIDGGHAASRPMSPGDSASFAVSAGDHSAGATAPTVGGVSIWFPQTVTLAPGQRYVLTMRC
jgi:hypothetical protein